MATFKNFEEIEVWQKTRELTQEIYSISSRGPFSKGFGLRDQVRRSSVSIMSNIAEGFERNGERQFSLAIETGRIIGGLMNYLHKSEIKANKFKLTQNSKI